MLYLIDTDNEIAQGPIDGEDELVKIMEGLTSSRIEASLVADVGSTGFMNIEDAQSWLDEAREGLAIEDEDDDEDDE